MLIVGGKKRAALSETELIRAVDEEALRDLVDFVAVPRHRDAEGLENMRIGYWIRDYLENLGYQTLVQGSHRNIVAWTNGDFGPRLLVGAHYDSVPFCPGADDNGSALAAMLLSAKVLAQQNLPLVFVAFNSEEDGHLGSDDFVNHFLADAPFTIAVAHILEMVGYCSHEPNSQKAPLNLPTRLPKTGDFLGILANCGSRKVQRQLLNHARSNLPELSVKGLRALCGIENWLPVLWRSDHAAFWHNRIPALMWTDTAEFRNPHYHKRSDLPHTLDYQFLKRVTQLLVLHLNASSLQ